VPDDQLAVVLHGLNGIVKDIRVVVFEDPVNLPVPVSAPKLSVDNAVKAIKNLPLEPRRTSLEKVTDELRHGTSTIKPFNAEAIQKAAKRAGYARSSYSYFANYLIKHKKIKKNTVRGWYNWV
jgi:hypothetical protein